MPPLQYRCQLLVQHTAPFPANDVVSLAVFPACCILRRPPLLFGPEVVLFHHLQPSQQPLGSSLRSIKFPTFPFNYKMISLVVFAMNGYKLFMLSSTGSSNHALVYDPAADFWQQFGVLNPILNENYHQKGVLYDGGLLLPPLSLFTL
ncbi:hypothetical protein C2S52_005554 [Perilla frutescens var. hirtella]|nr:hypothetical protein C2S52_005554 [Perilla frutescens var. hirtella]